MLSPIIKGFLIGSSFGVFAGLLGLMESIPRSILLGSLMGILAGATMQFKLNRMEEKRNEEKKAPQEK